MSLTCLDSDATVRALVDRHPDARHIEITGAGLNETFLTLTAATGPPDTGENDS